MDEPLAPYISYQDLDAYQDLDEDDANAQEQLRGITSRVSRLLDRLTGRRFAPYVATKYWDHPDDATRLVLRDDLLEVTTFTTENTATTISSSDYYLMCGSRYDLTPYDRIVLKSDGDQTTLSYSGTPQKANQIVGVWGYHEDYANAWESSGDTVQNTTQITAAGTSLTVTNADGADAWGVTPRFKPQQLLKIDSEFAYVTAVNASTNVLTIRRGFHGSTAATHANGTAIYVYRPMGDVVQGVLAMAAWLYGRREMPMTRVIESFAGGSRVTVPTDWPSEFQDIVARYRRRDYA